MAASVTRSPMLASGPALWQGTDVDVLNTSTYHLTQSDISDLNLAMGNASLRHTNVFDLGKQGFPLGQFGLLLGGIRSQVLDGSGFCLIRGIPVHRYSLGELRILLCGIGLHLGCAIPQNPRGELVTSVRDIGASDNGKRKTRGYQTGAALPFHSDSCDVVGLLCVHEAKKGGGKQHC